MCSKQNRRFKYKLVQHDHRNKRIKKIAKHISCKCKCQFDGIKSTQINGRITTNVYVSVKNIYMRRILCLEPCYI